MYTSIFSDLPNQVILATFTPFGCGSISFPKRNPGVIQGLQCEVRANGIHNTGQRGFLFPLRTRIHGLLPNWFVLWF
ncbi:Rho Gtpase-Activating Protein 9 [Manis pentadactyla]|nr:Rho Gtpase-Activating Protein 9 [Manis pentadactyla]